MTRSGRPAAVGRRAGGRDWTRIRMAAVAVAFGLCWLVLWGRAFQVQVLMGEDLSAKALRQHQAVEMASGQRGRILDRNGVVLAKSVVCRSVYARPLDVKDVDSAAAALAQALGGSAAGYKAKLRSRAPFVWLDRQVGDREAAAVEAAMTRLGEPGIHLLDEYRRLYPGGHLAGQLLGFVGLDGVGLEGLERSFQSRLVARRESFTVGRDGAGRHLYLDAEDTGRDTGRNALSGGDLSLTLDAEIQCMAERSLERAVSRWGGEWGGLMVLDAGSGDILAWAQYPFFNPNIYGRHAPATWRNRLAMDALEPGSTMKPFLVAAALQEGVVRPDDVFDCEMGSFEVSGKTIRDTHDYGELTVAEIVKYSSNIGAAKIGMQMGADRYHAALDKLGFGRRLGLPLPGESKGILRGPGRWYPVDLAAASFGQGVSATMAQMAAAYLCLANDGVLVRPRLLDDGSASRDGAAQVFAPEVAHAVMAMLTDAVEADGTGTQARIKGLRVAGKTGTAQKASAQGGYGGRYSASFVALVPADKPRFLVLCTVDEPHPQHYGGVVAAPAVRETVVNALAYLGRLPDPSALAQVPDSVEAREATALAEGVMARAGALAGAVDLRARTAGNGVPDVVGLPLRRAVELLARSGRVPDIKGQGAVVARQEPAAGRTWPKGGVNCVLWLSDPEKRS